MLYPYFMGAVITYLLVCCFPIAIASVTGLMLGFMGFGGAGLSLETSNLILFIVWGFALLLSIIMGKRIAQLNVSKIALFLLGITPSIIYYLFLTYLISRPH